MTSGQIFVKMDTQKQLNVPLHLDRLAAREVFFSKRENRLVPITAAWRHEIYCDLQAKLTEPLMKALAWASDPEFDVEMYRLSLVKHA